MTTQRGPVHPPCTHSSRAVALVSRCRTHVRLANLDQVASIYTEAADLMAGQYGEEHGGVNECRESAARLRHTAGSSSRGTLASEPGGATSAGSGSGLSRGGSGYHKQLSRQSSASDNGIMF